MKHNKAIYPFYGVNKIAVFKRSIVHPKNLPYIIGDEDLKDSIEEISYLYGETIDADSKNDVDAIEQKINDYSSKIAALYDKLREIEIKNEIKQHEYDKELIINLHKTHPELMI